MAETPERFRFKIIAPSRERAVSAARREAYKRGWIGTHLASCEPSSVVLFPAPTGPNTTTPTWDIVLEVGEQRGPNWNFQANALMRFRRIRAGVRVKTLAEGVNHAGGSRHVMPAGSIGVVHSRLGAGVRVRFDEVPGHSFIYAAQHLERVRDE